MGDEVWTRLQSELLDWLGAGFDAAKLRRNSHLRDDLGLSSLRTVDLIIKLEDTFDISISDDDVVTLTTLGDVTELIRRKLSEAPGGGG